MPCMQQARVESSHSQREVLVMWGLLVSMHIRTGDVGIVERMEESILLCAVRLADKPWLKMPLADLL